MKSEIAQLIEERKIPKIQIASALGISPSNFYNKLNRNNFSAIELSIIADCLKMKLALIPDDYISQSCCVIDYDIERKANIGRPNARKQN